MTLLTDIGGLLFMEIEEYGLIGRVAPRTAILIGSPLCVLTSGLLATKIAWGRRKAKCGRKSAQSSKRCQGIGEPMWNGGDRKGHGGGRRKKKRLKWREER